MKRFAAISDTTVAGEDIMQKFKAQTSLSGISDDKEPFLVTKLTLIADAELSVKINGEANYSVLHLDAADSKYKLLLDNNDVKIKTLHVEEDSVDFWAGFLF